MQDLQDPNPSSQPSWLSDVKALFKHSPIQEHLIDQLLQIQPFTHSIIVIYQKLFIKFHSKSIIQPLNSQHPVDSSNMFLLKITKSFPLDNSLRLYLLDANYQPKIFDTRDLIHEVLGKPWNFTLSLKQILQKIPLFEQKMLNRNQNYLAMQKTGDLLLGDVFLYNQLEQHTSLSLFPDKTHPQTSLLNGVSETHLLVFQRVVKKKYKSKEEEEYELKSKTLYGKKFMLSKFCELQCINSMQVTSSSKEVILGLVKYRSLRTVDQFQNTTKRLLFDDEESMRQFIRIVLKNLPKYQPTKITFFPSYQKPNPESKDQISPQRILELNELEQRLESRIKAQSFVDPIKQEELINRLNKSYQKMIEYYSARASPYYLIYVNKLNFLYQSFFIEQKGKEPKRKISFDEGNVGISEISEKDGFTISKMKMAKSLSFNS